MPSKKCPLTQEFVNTAQIIWAHIDLQEDFITNPLSDEIRVAHACKDNSEYARTVGIKNIWVAYTSLPKNDIIDHKDLRGKDRFHTISPQAGEKTYTKQDRNAALNKTLVNDLKSSDTRTIIIDGLYAKECVLESITGLLTEIDNLNIILAADATDGEVMNNERSYRRMLSDLFEQPKAAHVKAIQKRLHIMPSSNIQMTLRPEELSLA